MKVKQARLHKIKEIISSHNIRGQEELLKILIDEGYDLTQATLSRDLKSLMVAKATDENGAYKYIIPESLDKPHSLRRGYLSIKFSGNMAVINTLPGYANPLSVLIDDQEHEMILGTVAGDDTIILVLCEELTDREVLTSFIENLLKLN